MAATDKPYRDQRFLDMVFALSCLAMLGAVVWMFVQDYNGEWKTEQRVYYDVKAEMAMRQALDPEHVLLRPRDVEVVVMEQRRLGRRVVAAFAGERVARQLVDPDEDDGRHDDSGH